MPRPFAIFILIAAYSRPFCVCSANAHLLQPFVPPLNNLAIYAAFFIIVAAYAAVLIIIIKGKLHCFAHIPRAMCSYRGGEGFLLLGGVGGKNARAKHGHIVLGLAFRAFKCACKQFVCKVLRVQRAHRLQKV